MTAQAKTQNYTPEQTEEIVSRYKAGEAVEAIAEALGRSSRSIVAKLAREGVYEAKNKQKAPARMRKADLVDQIAKHCGVAPELFETLEKANLDVLEVIAAKLK